MFTTRAVDLFAPTDAAGKPRQVPNGGVQIWGTEVERAFAAFQAGGGVIFASKAAADANLAYAANVQAWVFDSDPLLAGVYQKQGDSGSGSWLRIGDLPYSFILAENVGAGTANAIQATTVISIPSADGGALISLPILVENTASPVTVSFNGGAALTIKTNSGNDVAPGGLTAGMIVAGYKVGTTFRLLSDQASAAIVAAAEAILAEIQATAATFQPFATVNAAVGGAVQSIDVGNPDAAIDQISLFIDGVYQFRNTFTVAAGVLSPVGGTWPGDGVTVNAEVRFVPAFVEESVPPDLSVTTPKLANEAVTEEKLAPGLLSIESGTPFGRAGIRVLKGLENDAHYGFNSGILDVGGGKWVIVYRKASNHTVVNGSQVMAADSYDKGATLENIRQIYTDPNYDTRNFVARVMANGHIGICASRRAEGTLVYTDPIFIYSDDRGVTWSSTAMGAAPGGTAINFHGNLIDYPTSVGGNDADGFIAYTYGGVAGTVDAFRTTDNGTTWSWSPSVATSVPTMTEISCSRIGTQDKWIMFGRPSGTVGDPGTAWVSNDP